MKKILAAVVALSMIGIPPVNAAVKSGANCPKVKATAIVKGLKYTCIKSGKKLLWSKGIPAKHAVPTPTVPATPSASSTPTVAPNATPTPKPTVASPTPSPTFSVRSYTMEQVRQNNTAKSCWAVVDGDVYDLTTWINAHPGGAAPILFLCGTDATNSFRAQHQMQQKPTNKLDSFLLGPLKS